MSAVELVLMDLHALRSNFRVIDFSIQDDHIHFTLEADGARAYRSGCYALSIRLGKRINAALGRSGRLFADRAHLRQLATPREVRNARAYVLLNRRRHLAKLNRPQEAGIDPFSSGAHFDGWTRAIAPARFAATEAPRTWLGRVGWRRHGLISPGEIPGRPCLSPAAAAWAGRAP